MKNRFCCLQKRHQPVWNEKPSSFVQIMSSGCSELIKPGKKMYGFMSFGEEPEEGEDCSLVVGSVGLGYDDERLGGCNCGGCCSTCCFLPGGGWVWR